MEEGREMLERDAQQLRQEKGLGDRPLSLISDSISSLERWFDINDAERKCLLAESQTMVLLRKKEKDQLLQVSELDSIGSRIEKKIASNPARIGNISISHTYPGSIVKFIGTQRVVVRNPGPGSVHTVDLPIDSDGIVALGAEMEKVLCVCHHKTATLSRYTDLDTGKNDPGSISSVIAHLLKKNKIQPRMIVTDLHPQYQNTTHAGLLAKDLDCPLLQVQHHKAHVASVAAEHGLIRFAGIACDGLGYGEDGKIWGGEVFLGFKRIGHLEEQPMIGGDSATINPRKMLYGILLNDKQGMKIARRLGYWTQNEHNVYQKMRAGSFNTTMTTSCGRVLDSVAALLGLCEKRTYEGRPAMLLESISRKSIEELEYLEPLRPIIIKEGGMSILKTTPLLIHLAQAKEDMMVNFPGKAEGIKADAAIIAHHYLAEGLYAIAEAQGEKIVFSGGVAFNRYITGYMLKKHVCINKEIPPGDGGICYGQAYYAALTRRNPID